MTGRGLVHSLKEILIFGRSLFLGFIFPVTLISFCWFLLTCHIALPILSYLLSHCLPLSLLFFFLSLIQSLQGKIWCFCIVTGELEWAAKVRYWNGNVISFPRQYACENPALAACCHPPLCPEREHTSLCCCLAWFSGFHINFWPAGPREALIIFMTNLIPHWKPCNCC